MSNFHVESGQSAVVAYCHCLLRVRVFSLRSMEHIPRRHFASRASMAFCHSPFEHESSSDFAPRSVFNVGMRQFGRLALLEPVAFPPTTRSVEHRSVEHRFEPCARSSRSPFTTGRSGMF